MDFAPTSQQQILIRTARAFLAQRCPPERLQALALEPGGFLHDVWKDMAALGWPGLLIPPPLGGSGGSILDVIVLVEEMGRACLPGPFVPSAMVATAMLTAAGSPAARRLLPSMALGERICAVAMLEESGGYEPEVLAVVGEAPGRLTGRKLFVQDAHVATDVVVIARGGDDLNALLLPRDRAGITLAPMAAMGDQRLFALDFEDVLVRREDLLGTAGGGRGLLEPAMRLGALGRGAEMVGSAARILDLCVEHARVRVQSGRPIGAFQAIQHQCADLLRDVETSRWLVYEAAWREAECQGSSATVATAKAFCDRACLAVARRGHQVMGAIGYCEEHLLHLLHKRILAATLDWGDSSSHLEAVARSIGLA